MSQLPPFDNDKDLHLRSKFKIAVRIKMCFVYIKPMLTNSSNAFPVKCCKRYSRTSVGT